MSGDAFTALKLLLFMFFFHISDFSFLLVYLFTRLFVYNNGGLKAQGLSIAQGKRSGTLGNDGMPSPPAPCKGKSPKTKWQGIECKVDIILLPLQGVYRLLYLYIPKVSLRLPWAMNALRLPFQGVCFVMASTHHYSCTAFDVRCSCRRCFAIASTRYSHPIRIFPVHAVAVLPHVFAGVLCQLGRNRGR